MCAICYAAEMGEDLSPEVQDGLEGNVRLDNGFMVPRFVVRPNVDEIPPDPVDGKDAKVGFGSYLTRVLKAAVFGAIKAGKRAAEKEPMSKQLAKQKRRSRVFAVEDMESDVIDPSIPTIKLGDEL